MPKANNTPSRWKSVSNKKMAKERLSKLQKWILEKCLKDLGVSYQDVYSFFGKKYSDRWGKNKVKFGLIWTGEKDKKGALKYREWRKKELTELLQRTGESFSDYEYVDFKYKKGWYIYSVRGWRPKKSLVITNSEKAIISRSLKGLVKKDFLIQPRKWREYRLTKAGFLKANKSATGDPFVSFKEYQKKVNKIEQEREGAFNKITEAFKNLKGQKAG